MPIIVQFGATKALLRRLDDIRDRAKASGRSAMRVRTDIQIIVERDHEEMMFRGVDRYGKPRAPLAESTLKKKPPRANPNSLIPHGYASRFISRYETHWDGTVLVQQFVGIVDKRGRSFAQYHLEGGPRLPRRDVGGITPAGWSQIVKRHKEFAEDVLRGK